jgi:hypothetical protein
MPREPHWRTVCRDEFGVPVEEMVMEVDAGHAQPVHVRGGMPTRRSQPPAPSLGHHVTSLIEEFVRHYETHGALPPADIAEAMIENAERNDAHDAELAEEEAFEPPGADPSLWREALGEESIAAMLGDTA